MMKLKSVIFLQWPWPNAIYVDENANANDDTIHFWGDASGQKYKDPKGQILDGHVYK